MPIDSPGSVVTPVPEAALRSGAGWPLSFRRFALFAAVLAILFSVPLYSLMRLALHSELYSHILLIPFISAYLIWIRKSELGVRGSKFKVPPGPTAVSRSTLHAPRAALLPFLVGSALLICYAALRWRGWHPAREDYLAFTTFSFLLFLLGGALFFLGSPIVKAVTFPTAMLLFMVPFPSVVKNGIEVFFQHTSADAASVFFSLSRTPLFREGLLFRLPGITLQVAEECSGIRSSMVLFITGLLAAHLFLRTPWKRAVLVLLVIPLGIVRNGFRIMTIGLLCVHIDPSIIDSPIHHRGGPIFFLLSLIPFFLILVLLRKSERSDRGRSQAAAPAPTTAN